MMFLTTDCLIGMRCRLIKRQVRSLILPTETPTRFVVVGTEREVIAKLDRQYGLNDNANLPERLTDYLEVSNTAIMSMTMLFLMLNCKRRN